MGRPFAEVGAGSIGQAIARRVSAGKHVVLADLKMENAAAAAEVMRNAGFEITTAIVDVSKRGNSLRVMAEAVRWGKRGARVNTISPGIIYTPLARDELTGPRGDGYRRMIELSAAGRGGTPDEVGAVGALIMGPEGTFITGSDFLMDGGVTAAYWFGDPAPNTKRLN